MDVSPPPFLSEDTTASLDALVVYETEDYLLIEITTARARDLIDSRHGFLDRLLSLSPGSTILELPELGALEETSSMISLEEGSEPHPFFIRPHTDTWHPSGRSARPSLEALRSVSRVRAHADS